MPRYMIMIDAPAGDGDALLEATGIGYDERIGMIIQSEVDGVPLPATVQTEIEAHTPREADRRARQAYADLRKRAGLGEPTGTETSTLHDLNPLLTLNARDGQFFRQADRLYDDGHDLYAVVAAQTACELFMEGAIQYALSKHASESLAGVIPKLLTTYSMRDSRGPQLWRALTGNRITEPEEVWRNYGVHVERRNAAVHQGAMVSHTDAGHSLMAVRDYCAAVANVLIRL